MSDLRPVVGSDNGTWGSMLLSWLGVSVNNDGTLNSSQVQNALGGSITYLPASNGTDDTAAINAILALGGAVAGKHGETYILGSPLVGPSGGGLDLSMYGCHITLKAAANCNMFKTYAATARRVASDASITASSTTITSASAAFTSADVGKAIRVWFGSTSGPWLDTTIASVTNSTTAVLSAAPTVTKTNASISIGSRDSNISIRGGHWDRGSVAGTGTDLHSIFLRGVDGFLVEDVTLDESQGKYMIAPADASAGRIRRVACGSVSSAAVQGNGPLFDIEVDGVSGNTTDDSVAFTGGDYAAYQDTAGDLIDIRVRGVETVSGQSNVKVIAGANRTADGIKIETVGGAASQYGVYLGDDTSSANTTGGTYNVVTVDGVDVTATTVVTITGGTWKRLILNRMKKTIAGSDYLVRVVGAAAIEEIEIDAEILGSTGGGNGVSFSGSSVVKRLKLNANLPDSPTTFTLVNVNGAEIDFIEVAGRLVFGDTSGKVVILQGSSTCSLVTARGLTQKSGRSVLDATSTTAGVRLHLNDCWLDTPSRVVNFTNGQSNVITIDPTVKIVTPVAEPVWVNTGSVTIYAGSFDCPTNVSFFNRNASETIRVVGPTVRGDVAKIATNVGDAVYNTNSSSAPYYVGPMTYNGSAWIPAQGFAKQYTLTLVGGAVTQADTHITSGSLIRVSRQAAGGTLGDLSVSLSASTSFTVNSSSASDTSTVLAEVAAY